MHNSLYAEGMCPCSFVKGKDTSTLKYEIGINTYTVQEALFNFWSPSTFHYYNTLPGLRFKLHQNNYSLRAGFDHVSNSYHLRDTNPLNYQSITGSSQMNVVRIGFEKTMIEGPLSIYTAADMVYANAHYKGNDQGHGDFNPGWNYDYTLTAKAIGVSPAIGIKYRPFKHWSIGLETQLNLMYYKVNYQYQALNTYKESGMALLFNPLGSLSLNYHFNR